MKNSLGSKSMTTGMSSNRQSTANNIAMMAKGELAQSDAFKYEMTEIDDKPIDIDEMQIDKLYQSL